MPDTLDRPVVLCVGGHDPSGGAGILADAEAVRAAGAFAVTVVSTLTDQDTGALRRIHPQPADHVDSQCRAMFEDSAPRALKIGLIGSSRIVRVLNTLIDEHPQLPVVLDPVLASGAGQQVVDAALLNQVKTNLIRRSTLITPNLPEARTLADTQDPERCGQRLLAAGARWVLITGTHAKTASVTNRLFGPGGVSHTWDWPRLAGDYHGSGCTLASAIAARLALGQEMIAAVAGAQAYTWNSLKRAFRTGRGQLTPDRLYALESDRQADD